MLKSNPLPFIRGNNNPLTALGNESDIKLAILSKDIDKVADITAINAIAGIIVRTNEKASCPGKLTLLAFLLSL